MLYPKITAALFITYLKFPFQLWTHFLFCIALSFLTFTLNMFVRPELEHIHVKILLQKGINFSKTFFFKRYFVIICHKVGTLSGRFYNSFAPTRLLLRTYRLTLSPFPN